MYDNHFDCGKVIEGNEDNDFSVAVPQNPVALYMEQGYNNSINCGGSSSNGEIYTTGSFPEIPYPGLLGMYPLPSCPSSNTLSQNSPNLLGFSDPFLPLNLPSQAQPSSLLWEFYHSGDYSVSDQGLINQDEEGDFGKDGSASERQKRKDFSVKYKVLKELIPNPTKDDRASIVGDTVEYIKELKKTVSELKFLVEKKRRAKESEEKVEDDWGRSSWVQKKSRNAEIDVRIMENDISMKIVVRRINCLLFVAKALDQLQLELHHVSGGAIGDFYTYFMNSKICEGSNVYASAVANKVIQVVDQLYTSN